MALKIDEVISLSPAAIKAGKELVEAADAIRDAFSVDGPKGRKVTWPELKRIAKETKQAAVACAKLLAELAFARKS
jgi:hypothetical protein